MPNFDPDRKYMQKLFGSLLNFILLGENILNFIKSKLEPNALLVNTD